MASAANDGLAIRAAVEKGLKDLRQASLILSVGRAARLTANQFFRLVTKNLATSGGHILAHKVTIELKHHVGAMLGQKTVARLAFSETLFRLDALVDIAANRMDGCHPSCGVS